MFLAQSKTPGFLHLFFVRYAVDVSVRLSVRADNDISELRLIKEIPSHHGSLFSCVACSQAANGEPLLFAGTADGFILQLAWSSGDCDGSFPDAQNKQSG